MMHVEFGPYRNIITRSYLLICLFWITVRAFSHVLPHQLHHPILKKNGLDFTFWFFDGSGIAAAISGGGMFGSFFALLVFLVPCLLFFFPAQNIVSIVFTAILLTINVTTNLYTTHNVHYMGAMLVISFAFWAKKEATFNLLWQGARYYGCWIYASAFIWKLAFGAMWQWDGGILSFKSNLAGYLLLNPDTLLAHFYYFLIRNEWLVNLGQKLVYLAEGAFILGFFTRRFDRVLIVLAIFIFISTMFFADVFFAEHLIIVLVFLKVSDWERLTKKMPFLNLNIFKQKNPAGSSS